MSDAPAPGRHDVCLYLIHGEGGAPGGRAGAGGWEGGGSCGVVGGGGIAGMTVGSCGGKVGGSDGGGTRGGDGGGGQAGRGEGGGGRAGSGGGRTGWGGDEGMNRGKPRMTSSEITAGAKHTQWMLRKLSKQPFYHLSTPPF